MYNQKWQASPLVLWVRQSFVILTLLNRQGELIRLESWATRKSLAGPYRSYRAQRIDTERVLFRYAHSSPLAYRFGTALRLLHRLISPVPRYMPKGSAASYRYLKQESRHIDRLPIV